ncbi:MAG: DUF2336 domain-containing protein [Alphaproteobacteria bacterium]|nr:DUF2336 domain-containing protein [Alphaproteobacteria bacterium]
MIGFIKKLFGGDAQSRLQKQKKLLATNDPKTLLALARDRKTHTEVLYFLARSEDPVIRRAVANNPAMPAQASALLALDTDTDVRMTLAARLVELLPALPADRQSQIYAYAVQALGMLAQDEVFKIRKALSTALRDYAKAPPPVVARLARDVEREIAEPILRFCVALEDEEMLDILSGHPEPWVISAIAARPEVSEAVSEAVVETQDAPGTAVLIGNSGAHLSVETLGRIVAQAQQYPEWHKPIAMRKELSVDLARQLAGFVNATILQVLEKRSDFDAATRQGVLDMVGRRIEYLHSSASGEKPEEKVLRLVKAGKLTPEVIQDALSWQERDFFILAIAYQSGIRPEIVRKMLSLNNAKPIIALCWRAKLPVRMCLDVQRFAGRLSPRDLLYPKGGTEYPLSLDEMKWQLEFFGIKS